MASTHVQATAPTGVREQLRAFVGAHPLVDLLTEVAAHDAVTAYQEVAGGVACTRTVRGPGTADSTLLDIEIGLGDLTLHTMRGGRFESVHPPEAFAVRRRTIHPGTSAWPDRLTRIAFGSEHGCSSDAEVPMFLISSTDGAAGLWFAVSWSGSWQAVLTKHRWLDSHRLTITGPGPALELADGEEIVLPSVVIGAYHNDGWTAVRDHLRASSPRVAPPQVVYNTWFNENAEIDAERMLATIEVAAEIGVEVVTLDGAWYETSGGDAADFTTVGIGTWTPDPIRFPDGLEPIAAAAEKAGLRFGLWCKIERAHPDSALGLRHPEWLRTAPGESLGLIDLGRHEAVEWCIEQLTGMVERWRLGWLKLDMTTHDIAAYWAGDAKAELAHIRGLYRVFDELRRRCPELIVEGCASGGMRIDREMVSRCDTFWLSDQTHSPDLVRGIVANARTLLPAQYCYLSVSPGLPEAVANFPDSWFLGVMPGVFGIMDPLRTWPQSLRDQAAAHIARHRSIRNLLDGAPTRLTGDERAPLADWDGLEVVGDDGSLLFAHRLGSDAATHVFVGSRRWEATIAEPGGAHLQVMQFNHS